MYWRLGGIVAIIIVVGGCNSVRTTFLKNDGRGNLCKESNICRQGLPVMVKVPTHVDVEIIQTDVWKVEKNGTNPRKLVHIPDATSRSHKVTPIATEKMFVIDPKRPASGTGAFGFGFDSTENPGKGILTSAAYKSEDTTLKDSANLLLNAVGVAGKLTSTNIDQENDKLVSAERTIAYRRFPVDQDLSANIQAFLNEYITNCTEADPTCSKSPSYAR